jgi:CDP-paratose 2-epimerase
LTTRSILVTGGAGFIGSSLALAFRQSLPDSRIIAFDSLRRRGSELNLDRLRQAGVQFVHGDVRVATDLETAGDHIDTLIECSAEPSVLAGFDGNPRYVIDTNLMGLANCLELARRHEAVLVFLSTSRVYPTRALSELLYREAGERFVLADEQSVAGASQHGIAENFPLDGARTLYGATKLAAELLIAEYVDMFGLRAVIDRCGVVSGPWQMGKVEQGVFALWMLAHVFGRPLKYIGYGGTGQQVRDVLHVQDLASLLEIQIARADALNGEVFNVGGGTFASASLAELTALCAAIAGRQVPITMDPRTRPGDVPIYISDARKVQQRFGWAPTMTIEALMRDLFAWATGHRAALEKALP